MGNPTAPTDGTFRDEPCSGGDDCPSSHPERSAWSNARSHIRPARSRITDMKSFAPALCLLLLACSDRSGTGNDDALLIANEATVPLSPGTQPVRIGEGGPAFQACSSLGRVVNLSPAGETYLPVRAAPFTEADEQLRLGEGAQIHVCTRSIDQRWLGVVIAPLEAPETDCGVNAPVASPRTYAGPCKSGWVSSAFVRLIAG